jgi:hypothetical protein
LEPKTLLHLQECLRQIIDKALDQAKYLIANIGLDIVTTYFENFADSQKTDMYDADGKMIINDLNS